MTIRTIDAHADGGPLRLIVDGFPSLRGSTMAAKEAWAAAHADSIRRSVLLEPRGHDGMCGAVLTEPVAPGSHAGLVFMHTSGYAPMSGHGIIAATAIALSRGLLMPGGDGSRVVYDTVAGTVRATLAGGTVSFENVPAFVLHGGLTISLGPRQLRVDVAFGGAFYAIVDSEAAGVGVDPRHALELRRTAAAIMAAVEATRKIAHPTNRDVHGIHGVVFTGPAGAPGADLRNVTVFGHGQIDRSPSGTATAAVMAVIAAMGLVGDQGTFVHEGLVGTTNRGRIVAQTMVGDYEAVVCELTGSAWITGEHVFVVEEADPFREGFRV